MPTQTSLVGSKLIPVPTGGTNSALNDPTLDGLLAYFGFLIKNGLDAKLAEMGGPTTSAPITDSCPVANRFPYNHDNAFVRPIAGAAAAPLPGLWAWETASKTREQTLYYDVLERTIAIQYIFPQLAIPNAGVSRAGLLGAIARIIAKGVARGEHPSFAYGTDASGVPYQNGTPIYTSLGLTEWPIMVSGTPGLLLQVPQTPRGDAGGSIQRGFPSYLATFTVCEKIQLPQPVIPQDLLGDSPNTIAVYDDEAQPLDILTREILPPDGSTDPP